MLEVRLLGQFDLRLDGVPIKVPSRPAQALLAYLLLRAGTAHRREKLAGSFWPEAAEANARNNLRVALWRIRKALETGGRTYLLADDLTVTFDTNASYWLDVSALEREARSVDDLIGCVSVYHGELLPGFYDEWVVFERERWHAVFEQKMQALLDRLVAAGRWPEAVEWGERWIALGQPPEPAYRALMLAHAGLGDVASAAAVFQRCAEALRRDLGVEPSEQTRALFERLSKGETPPGPPTPPSRPETARSAIGNLSAHAQPTPFVGREEELAEIVHVLQDPNCRLLTLIGPGGIGKTRLSLEAAARLPSGEFPDGAWFVPLASLGSAEFIVPAIASALRFTFYGAQDPKAQLFDHLRDRRMLLALDSFEHLLDGSDLLTEMLVSLPGVRFLVTSRERLNLRGEWLLDIGGMKFPEGERVEDVEAYSAVRLFVQSARRARPGFALVDERPGVVRLCQLLGGMPLGLELAAAWVRALSTADIASEIEHSLGFLTTSLRDVPERHRSLRAVFDHSWQRLSQEEQRAFRDLSVFRGGFEREAAERVAGASLQVLSALVDKSLLRSVPRASGRCDMHELLRQYAHDRLVEAGEADAAHRRHRDWYLALTEPPPNILWGTIETSVLKRFDVEHDNLRAALQWSIENGEAEERLRLAGGAVWFWYLRAYFDEGRRWLEQALARSEGASAWARATALQSAGVLAEQQCDYELAAGLLEEALALFRGEDLWNVPWMLLHLGFVVLMQGDYERATALHTESLALFREMGNKGGVANLLMYLGIGACYQRDYERAVPLLEESLPLLREVADDWGIARALYGLGVVARHRGDFRRAAASFAEGLAVSHKRGDRAAIAECLEGLAGTACAQGQGERAARIFGAAEALRKAIATPMPPGIREDYERDVAAVRAQFDEKTFAMEWAEGQALTMEQAMEYALSGEHGSAE